MSALAPIVPVHSENLNGARVRLFSIQVNLNSAELLLSSLSSSASAVSFGSHRAPSIRVKPCSLLEDGIDVEVRVSYDEDRWISSGAKISQSLTEQP